MPLIIKNFAIFSLFTRICFIYSQNLCFTRKCKYTLKSFDERKILDYNKSNIKFNYLFKEDYGKII